MTGNAVKLADLAETLRLEDSESSMAMDPCGYKRNCADRIDAALMDYLPRVSAAHTRRK